MVKKLFLVSLVLLTPYISSGCTSFINTYRSNFYLVHWEKLANKRQYDKAEEAIEKAIRYDARNVRAWTALGDVYLKTEDFREAKYAYEEALRLDSNAFGAYSGLMAVKLEENGYSDNIKKKVNDDLVAFENMDRQNAERLMTVFNILNFLHEDDKAAVVADEIIKLSPGDEISKSLSNYLSEEILREKDVEKRLKKCEIFLDAFPFAKEAVMVNYIRLGIVQKDLKDRNLLFRLGEEWLQREPESRRANFSVGYWYTEEGVALERAVSYIIKAIELIENPDPADKPDFYPYAEWLKDLQRTKGTYLSTLGLAYSRLGRTGLAEESYRKAAEFLVYDEDLYLRLGTLLQEAGKTGDAINAYVQALKSGESTEAEERLIKLLNTNAAYDGVAPAFMAGKTQSSEELHKYFALKEGVTPFIDVTTAAGLGGVHASRIAWGDYDNDGFEDILLNGSALFRNNGDGSFRNVTVGAGISQTDGANGGIWGDIDNDGFLDFYTFATGKENTDRLWRNNGDNTFSDITVTSFSEPDSYPTEGAAWGDYDSDGFIDLYLANYERPLNETIERGRCYRDHLYHNNGDLTFDEVSDTTRTGMRENMCGRGVSWGDYDNDGDSDIYVSNYRLDPNLLWNNNGDGTFTNLAAVKGAEGYETEGAYGHTIGSEWGDYDNDGDLDLFVSNLAHPRYIGYSDKSMLLENQGPPDYKFIDRFGKAGIRFEETSAEPSIADYDNDGFADIFFTSTYKGKKSYLYKGRGDGTFTDITWLAGVRVDDGWGNAFADYDNDGDLDLAAGGGEGLRLFRNDGNENHWLHVRVVGNGSNRAGIGAMVIITPSEKTASLPLFRMQIREIGGGKGSGSQHSLPAEFGLGSYSGMLDVEIRFPSGKVTRAKMVAPDQIIVVNEN